MVIAVMNTRLRLVAGHSLVGFRFKNYLHTVKVLWSNEENLKINRYICSE